MDRRVHLLHTTMIIAKHIRNLVGGLLDTLLFCEGAQSSGRCLGLKSCDHARALTGSEASPPRTPPGTRRGAAGPSGRGGPSWSAGCSAGLPDVDGLVEVAVLAVLGGAVVVVLTLLASPAGLGCSGAVVLWRLRVGRRLGVGGRLGAVASEGRTGCSGMGLLLRPCWTFCSLIVRAITRPCWYTGSWASLFRSSSLSSSGASMGG